jgi:HEAT repeat protein
MIPQLEQLNHESLQERYAAQATFIAAGQDSIPVLTAGLAPTYPEEIRWRSAASLVWINDVVVIPALEQAAQGAEYELKYNCIWGLGQLADPVAIPYLMAIVNADDRESPDVRYNAALALARLGQAESLRPALESTTEATYRVAHGALATARYGF